VKLHAFVAIDKDIA